MITALNPFVPILCGCGGRFRPTGIRFKSEPPQFQVQCASCDKVDRVRFVVTLSETEMDKIANRKV